MDLLISTITAKRSILTIAHTFAVSVCDSRSDFMYYVCVYVYISQANAHFGSSIPLGIYDTLTQYGLISHLFKIYVDFFLVRMLSWVALLPTMNLGTGLLPSSWIASFPGMQMRERGRLCGIRLCHNCEGNFHILDLEEIFRFSILFCRSGN